MEKIFFKGDDHTNFFKTLTSKVSEYLTTHKLSGKGTWNLHIKTMIIFLATGITYFSLLYFSNLTWVTLGLYIILGGCLTLIGFNVMHDGAHGSYSKNKRINKIIAHTIDFLGTNAYFRKIKHNHLHHTYTNIEQYDDDIAVKPFFRVNSYQPKYWFHKFQYLYAPLLYMFVAMRWFIRDFVEYFKQQIGQYSFTMKTREQIFFWITKTTFVGLYLIIPIIFLGREIAVSGFFIMSATMGIIIAHVFQLAHVVEKTQFTVPNSHHIIEDERAIHEIQTTANFATKNKFLTRLLGGLNFQVEHHLFPAISHIHYPALSTIVKQTCDEFGIQYNNYKTFLGAMHSHFKYLYKMGR